MVEARKHNNQNNSAQSAHDDPHVESVVTAFNALMSGLSAEKQEAVRSKIGVPPPAAKPGQVLRAILKLVPRDRPMSIEDIKKGVESEGVQATAKAIYNALGYLHRKRTIQRVGHGLYIVDGQAMVTSDELGGQPSRVEEHDPN